MSIMKFVCKAVRNFESHLVAYYDGKFKLPRRAEHLFKMDHDPELDRSPEMEPGSYIQYIIGIIKWMTELGRINKITNLSSLSSDLTLPREGYLDAAVHVTA